MESDGSFCDRCKTRFRSKNAIDKYTCKTLRDVVCTLCEKVIVSMKTHRSMCPKLQCSNCNKRFERIQFLTAHKNKCGSKRCRLCHKDSAQIHNINCPKLICTECGKRFPYQSDLQRHTSICNPE